MPITIITKKEKALAAIRWMRMRNIIYVYIKDITNEADGRVCSLFLLPHVKNYINVPYLIQTHDGPRSETAKWYLRNFYRY